jgi:zinc transport system substrate-binding protein
MIVLNGAHYAKWIEKASLPQSKMINTSKKFKSRWIKLENNVTHTHGKEGGHTHTGTAFTTWLNPQLAVQQAQVVKNALSKLLPGYESEFTSNFTSLKKDLLDLDQSLVEVTQNKENVPLLASHPVYQYLQKRYSLNLRSVHWEPDEVPDEKDWKELKNILSDHKAKWMIWESEPVSVTIEKLKELGIQSIVFNPCVNKPQQGDYLTVMRQNIENLRVIFK